MSADVQWSDVDVFPQGLNEHVDPRVLPAGQLVIVENGEWRRPGGIRKRPGCNLLVNGSVAVEGAIPRARALVRHENSHLVIDDLGSASRLPRVFSWDEDTDLLCVRDTAPNATMRVNPIAADFQEQMRTEIAYAASKLVYGITHETLQKVYVRVRDAATGVLVHESLLRSGSSTVRVAAANDRYVLVTYDDVADGTKLYGRVIDLDAGVSVGAQQTIVTNKYASKFYWDAIGLTNQTLGGKFAIFYIGPGDSDLVIRVLDTQPLTVGTATWTDANPVSAISILEHGDKWWTNWFGLGGMGDPPPAPSWRYRTFNASTAAALIATTAWWAGADAGLSAHRSAIGPGDTTLNAVLFHSLTTTSATKCSPITRWRRVDNLGVMDAPNEKGGLYIQSKPWKVSGAQNLHIWTTAHDARDKTARTYALIDWPNDVGGQATSSRAELLASSHSGRIPDSELTENTVRQVAFDGRWYRTGLLVNYVPLEEMPGPREFAVQYGDDGRNQYAYFAGLTYIANGVVTYWDGVRLGEVGFAKPPEIKAEIVLAGGQFPTTGTYSYIMTYETMDAKFNRHISALSAPKSATITSVETEAIKITFDVLHATRRYQGPGQTEITPIVMCVLYRAEPNSDVYQRIYSFQYMASEGAFESNPDDNDKRTFTDLHNQAGAGKNSSEILYTVSGELENDPIEGGGTTICVHKDRLWVGGGEDPEMIWYSKPRIDFRPAEFSLAQRIRVPGEQVVALASMDDALIIFCKKSIYAVFGEGPDARGLGGDFSPPTLLDQNVGCISPRSVVVAQPGTFFQSQRGIELLDRSRTVSYIGAPIEDTFLNYGRPMGACVVPKKGQVRFALCDSVLSNGRTAVFDYVEQKWAVWNYASNGVRVGVSSYTDIDTGLHKVLMLAKDGSVYFEDEAYFLDYESDFRLIVESGWLSFGRAQGHKKIRRVVPLMQRLGPVGFSVNIRVGYNDNLNFSRSWSEAEVTAIVGSTGDNAALPLRVHNPFPKTPALKVKVTETEGQNSEGFAFQGFTFEVGQLPGPRRMGANNSR